MNCLLVTIKHQQHYSWEFLYRNISGWNLRAINQSDRANTTNTYLSMLSMIILLITQRIRINKEMYKYSGTAQAKFIYEQRTVIELDNGD